MLPHKLEATFIDQPQHMVFRNLIFQAEVGEPYYAGDTFYRGRGPDIVDVEEKWVSPDLKLTVLAKDTTSTNPGEETIREIRELDRSEPDPALFEIPTNYKVLAK